MLLDYFTSSFGFQMVYFNTFDNFNEPFIVVETKESYEKRFKDETIKMGDDE